ncbi:MAG: SLATT domain-containing protein [Proteobacteria bacterium]|nr:SLATT domain-containing protein [Pseudomonadota bacterium]
MYQRAEKHALDAIEWYLLSKRQKKFWAQQLRLGTIGLTALAGLLPIISEIFQSTLSPAWASVALGAAGVVLAVDKFCGYSTAWMRFIAAEHQIRQSLHEFQMDYELEQAGWDNAQPGVEQTQAILTAARRFCIRWSHHPAGNRSVAGRVSGCAEADRQWHESQNRCARHQQTGVTLKRIYLAATTAAPKPITNRSSCAAPIKPLSKSVSVALTTDSLPNDEMLKRQPDAFFVRLTGQCQTAVVFR